MATTNPHPFNVKRDGTYAPLGERLETILRMRDESYDWGEIAAAVELPWQTCHSLARVVDEHIERVVEEYAAPS